MNQPLQIAETGTAPPRLPLTGVIDLYLEEIDLAVKRAEVRAGRLSLESIPERDDLLGRVFRMAVQKYAFKSS
jgi:hypothetical protein